MTREEELAALQTEVAELAENVRVAEAAEQLSWGTGDVRQIKAAERVREYWFQKYAKVKKRLFKLQFVSSVGSKSKP